METKNYQITIFKGTTGKTVKKFILNNCTEEQLEHFIDKAREHFTWTTETYCDAIVQEIKQ